MPNCGLPASGVACNNPSAEAILPMPELEPSTSRDLPTKPAYVVNLPNTRGAVGVGYSMSHHISLNKTIIMLSLRAFTVYSRILKKKTNIKLLALVQSVS